MFDKVKNSNSGLVQNMSYLNINGNKEYMYLEEMELRMRARI